MPSVSRKIIVVDTNIILHDYLAITKYPGCDIHIPMKVIEEVDKFKRDSREIGRHARSFSRFVDKLREKGKWSDGIQLDDIDSKIFIEYDLPSVSLSKKYSFLEANADNDILSSAFNLQKKYPDIEVILLSKDINLRIKSDVVGVNAQDYNLDTSDVSEFYTGVTEVQTSEEQINEFYYKKSINLKKENLIPNQYIIMKDGTNPNHSAIGRYDDAKKEVVTLLGGGESLWGITPRNVEQSFALDSLLNDKIKLVSLSGKAGTGKTLLALAAGLHKTLDLSQFSRLLVSRPIFPMGKDIGYLPGAVEEKLAPWMQPIFDNVELLLGNGSSFGKAKELLHQGLINIEPLTYIRGRSIPNQYLIVDEAQNLTPHEVKTIITRAGKDTKIVLTGDPNQIDNPYIDASSSGLTYLCERFKGYDIASHIELTKGERSELAELASNVL